MEFVVSGIVNKQEAYTNKAFLTSNSFSSLFASSGSKAQFRHVLLRSPKGKPTALTVDSSTYMEDDNQIALNKFQRTGASVEQGDKVQLSALPADELREALVVEVTLKYLGKYKVTVEEDQIAERIRSRLEGMALNEGQEYLVEYQNGLYTINVLYLDVTKKGTKRGDELTERSPFGAMTTYSTVNVTALPNPVMQFKQKKSLLKGAKSLNMSDLGIGGLDTQFDVIFRRAFATRLLPPDYVAAMGITHIRGMLLYGPPGTGKTLIARKIGQMLGGREPKVINGPEVLNKFVGQTEENIRELFRDAEEDYAANGENADLHIIIFDEIDAICKQRGTVGGGTGVHDTLVNQLLSKMDGVNSLNNILVIGMTNRKDLIDQALLRPGRMELHLEIGLPDEKGRYDIFLIHTKRMRDAGKCNVSLEDFKEFARRTKNYSGAEIQGVVKEAQSFAAVNFVNTEGEIKAKDALDDLVVTKEHFEMAVENSSPAFGLSEEDIASCMNGGFYEYSDDFKEVMQLGKRLLLQVKERESAPIISLLLKGPPGNGKTAVAARFAQMHAGDYPFIRMIRPESLIGYSEGTRAHKIQADFEDAYKSNLSIIVIDNIERLLEFVGLGMRFSNAVLQTLLVLCKKVPPTPGRRIMIIATTSLEDRVLREMGLETAFDVITEVPQIETADQVKEVLNQVDLTIAQEDVDKIAEHCPKPVGIKKLLFVLNMAHEQGDHVTYENFKSCANSVGLREDDYNQLYSS